MNFWCSPHASFPAGTDSAPSHQTWGRNDHPFVARCICTLLDPAVWSPCGAGSHRKSRASPPAQQSVPAQPHGPADAPHGFEDSLAKGRELGNAHSMNFSFLLQSILLSASIKREGDSPTASPHSSDDIHHSDRYQVSRRTPSLVSASGREPARPSARSSLRVRAQLSALCRCPSSPACSAGA